MTSLPGTIVVALFGAVGFATTASAQTRDWTTTTPNGDAGDWSDTTKWTGTNVPDTVGENANFVPYANGRVVTLDGDFTIGSLTVAPRTSRFSGQNFTLQLPAVPAGTEILRLNSGVTIDNGNTANINVPIEVVANQTWNALSSPAGSANFSGTISGAGKITRTAANAGSVFTFTGASTFAGGFQQSAANSPTTRVGSSSIVGGGVITSGPLGLGTLTFDGGTLSSNDGTARTLHNNLIIAGTATLGRTGNVGALTFSDADLTSPSTFTLGSATSGNVTNLRVGTNISIDQAIAEAGGSNQGILFSTITGTPTVTLNRTKSAGGPIIAGGVSLVLANGAANTGGLIGVAGAITATGANKFSSGSLVVDGTSLIASDLTNFSDVTSGKATVSNNGRVSFATDQTQATWAALITSDSQFRLGLGSGSGSATVTENYDLSTLGNGRAGLVSASSGTITYSGTLVVGADSTYRVGGGLGTLALTNALTGIGNNLIVEGGNSLTSTANNTFTGTTVINSSATLSGAAGAFSGTTAVTVNAGATLTLTNNTAAENANRIGNSVGITLNNSLFQLSGSSTTAASETLGNLTIGAGGRSFVTIATTPAAATVKTLQFGDLIRQNNSVVTFRGDTMGTTATARNEIKFTTAPTLVGGGGAAGTTNISILPWARGGTGSANGSTGFITYGSNGIRRLDGITEFVQANNNTTARIDQAIATAGGASTYNVRSIPNTTGGATLVDVASSNVTVNSLLFDNAAATGANTYSLNSSTINVTSGAVHIQHGVSQNVTIGSGTLAFGSNEGVITSNNSGFLTAISAQISGSAGVSIYNVNGGSVSLSGDKSFTGGLTIGGNGSVAVDQDGRLGAPGGSVTHGGGTLQFFSGFTTTRDLILLGGVGDNTLANSNTFTHTWNGNISGGGRLRLTNNATTPSTAGYALGGINSYTGGTLIDGISVTATSDNSFGSGTVSLLGGSFGAGSINFTSVAPVIGGLRGSGGTVIITPVATSATISIGSANESGLFAGNITQGAGKTASLAKVGTGKLILTGNNSYTGNTTVTAGTLGLGQPTLDNASIVNVATAGTLNLTYTGTDVVGEFQINGVTQAPGIYGAIGSGAPITTARITGTGRIQSTTGASDPYLTFIGGFPSLTGPNADKSADPDFDGLSNYAEYALDGNPTSGAADGKSRSRIEGLALVITIPVLDGAVFDNVPGPSADTTVGNTTYIIEGSNDLVTFNQGVTEIAPSTLGLIAPNTGYTQRTFRLNGDIGGGTPRGPKGFLRVKIISNP